MKPAMILSVLAFWAGSTSAFAGCASFESLPSRQTADVTFVNGTKGKINVLWYKFGGGTRKYFSLAPGQAYLQPTYTNHVWAFTDAKGKCVSTFVVKGSRKYTIQ